MTPIAPSVRPRHPRTLCALLAWAALTGHALGAGAHPVADPAVPLLESRGRALEPPLLGLVLRTDSSLLAEGPLAEALSRELGVVVLPLGVLGSRRVTGVITISWRPRRAELAVSYSEPGRGVVSRVVRAPADAETAAELAISLAGNLARDQVGDLLGTTPATAPPAGLGVTVGTSAREVTPRSPSAAPLPILNASPYRVPADAEAAAPPTPRTRIPITFAWFHPLATNGDWPDVATSLHLNLIYGRVGELNGLALGGWSAVEGPVHGVQLGLAGGSAGTVEGVQLGTLVSLTRGELVGLQAASAFNGTGGDLHGVQATFGLNDTQGSLDGLQLGAVNVTEGAVRGVQVGLVNVAGGRVQGLQLGLVNIADDVEGLPLGLVSVSRTGAVDPILWTSTLTQANAGVKLTNGNTYSILALAMAIEYPDTGLGPYHFLGPGLAIGRRFPLVGTFTLDSDMGVGLLSRAPDCCRSVWGLLDDYELLPRWRASLGFDRPQGSLSPFVGGGMAVKIHRQYGRNQSADVTPEIFAGLSL